VNFLLPRSEFGEGWGGVKKLRLLQGLLYVLKLEGDFKVSVYREVNGENTREIICEQNFEKCQFSEPVKISPINLLQNEKAGRIYRGLQA